LLNNLRIMFFKFKRHKVKLDSSIGWSSNHPGTVSIVRVVRCAEAR